MKRAIDLRPGVAEEIADALRYHDAARPGLGAQLLDAVSAAVEQITRSPEIGTKWQQDETTRRWPVRRFPYFIFYRFSEESITIVAVAHGRRRPGYWR